jgi:hypothetical protein
MLIPQEINLLQGNIHSKLPEFPSMSPTISRFSKLVIKLSIHKLGDYVRWCLDLNQGPLFQ